MKSPSQLRAIIAQLGTELYHLEWDLDDLKAKISDKEDELAMAKAELKAFFNWSAKEIDRLETEVACATDPRQMPLPMVGLR